MSTIFTSISYEFPDLTFNGAIDYALGGLDGDGDLDVFASMGYSGGNITSFNDGSGNFDPGQFAVGFEPYSAGFSAALGDLDGDGDLDAFVTRVGPNGDQILFNDGSGDFSNYTGPTRTPANFGVI